jgi:hypothetical protein
LLAQYCIAHDMAAKGHEALETEGHLAGGKPSGWVSIYFQSIKVITGLSHRLRLSPQGRSPKIPTRPQPQASAYQREELDADDTR